MIPVNGRKTLLALAALLWGAASLPAAALAGSCCGGGGGGGLLVPKGYEAVADLSLELEKYDGFWDGDGDYRKDPPDSDLRQYRLTLGVGKRLGERWQTSLSVPWVWNRNTYGGIGSSTDGLGDLTASVWYEALGEKNMWRLDSWSDATPSVILGASLLAPTGTSPYNGEGSSFDVTGRGFYRLDFNLNIDKSFRQWSASSTLAYGVHAPRMVNREYGKYVEPYKKELGDRFSGSLRVGYTLFVGTGGDSFTLSETLAHVSEADGKVDGERDPSTGFDKTTVTTGVSYASTDHGWKARLAWTHCPTRNGWGENFPVTDTYSLGVQYAIR